MNRRLSWVSSANERTCEFPLENLPYGVFSTAELPSRCGVAIGDQVLDVAAAESQGLLSLDGEPVCQAAAWNSLMAREPAKWRHFRQQLTELLAIDSPAEEALKSHCYPQSSVELHLPFIVNEFTDFYAGRHHATNVGTMFRGADNALPPNWLHMPIGYNGRASSVVVSGTAVTRPWGQLKSARHAKPVFLPSRRFDFELELGAIVGTSSTGPVTVDTAQSMIFGFVLLNDWSARDIQAWEYQPLGPFQAKASATSISPWIVSAEALEPFRAPLPEREFPLLDHLIGTTDALYDIELDVWLQPDGGTRSRITRSNARELYYSAAQQLAHHASCGCPMRTGDLLGSGTISGPERSERGSLLELSWGGEEPVVLEGDETRTFLDDGDTIVLAGRAHGDGYRLGFGECSGRLLAAHSDPFGAQGDSR